MVEGQGRRSEGPAIKILAICAALDLGEATGSTPAWWQLFKGMSELGAEVIVVPYRGRNLDSLWWKSYPNPTYYQGKMAYRVIAAMSHFAGSDGKNGLTKRLLPSLARKLTKPRWERHVLRILEEEEPDAVLFVQTPLNQLSGLPSLIRNEFGLPAYYYDGDMPANLPRFGGFTVDYYHGADLTEYDAFIINSKGSVDELRDLGASEVKVVYWGVDPSVFAPVACYQDIDVFFYGAGSVRREKEIDMLIKEPSEALSEVRFVHAVSKKMGIWKWREDVGMGKSQYQQLGSFVEYKLFSSRGKINLSITRHPHVDFYASATCRPFELASMGCCIVSSPYKGIEEWFEVGKELFVADSAKEAVELYVWLLDDDDLRQEVGMRARERLLKEHTHQHMAGAILDVMRRDP